MTMSKIKNLFFTEPALFVAVLEAVVLLAVAFGLSLTEVQIAAISAVATAIAAVIVRANVVPLRPLREFAESEEEST